MPKELAKRRPDPFDGSAIAHLRRMGLLTGAGDVDDAAMGAFIRIFTASFFDDLCDAYEDQARISKVAAAFHELEEGNDAKRIFLMISLQYDALRKPLPDPVWWLAGHPAVLTRFALGFAPYLAQLAADMEITEKEGDPGEITDCGAQ